MGIYIAVPQDSIAIIERFGRYHNEVGPGFHLLINPLIFRQRALISTRIIPLYVEIETKTSDNVTVTLVACIQYQIRKGEAAAAYYTFQNAVEQIKAYIYDAVRAAVPKLELNAVFESKKGIATTVLKQLREQISQYGYEIIDVLIVDVRPNAHVRESLNEISASQKAKQAAQYKAEALYIETIKIAEAKADAQYYQGKALAEQRNVILNGFKESVNELKQGQKIATKDATDIILLIQYFDALKSLVKGSKSRTVFYCQEDSDTSLITDLREAMLQAGVLKNI